MSRDKGFETADIAVGQLDDIKFRALWRKMNDAAAMSQAVVIYHASVLASWDMGERVAAGDAAPLWLDPSPDTLRALVEVGLLDDEHKIPAHAWDSWYSPALTRREAKKAGGRRGGLAAHGIRPEPDPEHSSTIAQAKPDPSGPSVRPVSSVRAVNARTTGLKNGHDDTTCPGCGDMLHPGDPNVTAGPGGQLWHTACPTAEAIA